MKKQLHFSLFSNLTFKISAFYTKIKVFFKPFLRWRWLPSPLVFLSDKMEKRNNSVHRSSDHVDHIYLKE